MNDFCAQVESEDQYERIGGTATGGGTFWGLGSLVTKAKVGDKWTYLHLSLPQECPRKRTPE